MKEAKRKTADSMQEKQRKHKRNFVLHHATLHCARGQIDAHFTLSETVTQNLLCNPLAVCPVQGHLKKNDVHFFRANILLHFFLKFFLKNLFVYRLDIWLR